MKKVILALGILVVLGSVARPSAVAQETTRPNIVTYFEEGEAVLFIAELRDDKIVPLLQGYDWDLSLDGEMVLSLSNSAITVYNLATGESRPLYRDILLFDPRLSPKGRFAAFTEVNYNERPNVVWIGTNGLGIENFYPGVGIEQGTSLIDWYSEDELLVFVVCITGCSERGLYLLNIKTETLTFVVTNSSYEVKGEVSATGETAYTDAGALYLIRPGELEPTFIANSVWNPVWSEDGSKLAYVTSTVSTGGGNQIHIQVSDHAGMIYADYLTNGVGDLWWHEDRVYFSAGSPGVNSGAFRIISLSPSGGEYKVEYQR